MTRTYRPEALVLAISFALLVVVYICDFGTKAILIRRVWDDGYMFARYAYRFLQEGVFAWNPGGEPTYGCTSVLYMLVMTVLHGVLPLNHTELVQFSSLLFGIGFFLLIPLLFWSLGIGSTSQRLWFSALVLWLLLWYQPPLLSHMFYGMDLMFCLCYLAVFYLAWLRTLETNALHSWRIATGALAGLGFWVRPDSLCFTYGVLAIHCLLSYRTDHFRARLQSLGIATGVLLLVLTINGLYFSTPLPLPFYAKSTGIYGSFIQSAATKGAALELGRFFSSYMIFWILAFCGVVRTCWAADRERKILVLTVCCTVAVFVYYLRFHVLHIMGHYSRLYHPLLSALFLLAGQNIDALQHFRKSSLRRLPDATFPFVFLCLILSLLPVKTTEFIQTYRRILNQEIPPLTPFNDYALHKGPSWWFALPELAAVKGDWSMATTEVGLAGTFARDRTCYDLAGLNETTIALNGFSVDWLLNTARPDLLYLPHQDYKQMNQDILSSQRFHEMYDHFDEKRLKRIITSDVALRRDSPVYEEMKNILENWLPPSHSTDVWSGRIY